MGNSNEGIENLDEELNEDLDEELDESLDEDTTDWKAEAKKQAGIAKRNATKLKKLQTKPETKTETKKESETKETLDYGQKAFLVANGIKGKEEIDLVKEYLANGKELDDVVENKHFQNDLKDLREAKAVKDATPSGSKRSGTSARDSVDYWLAKGELPPTDQVQLRRDVVNARMKKETSGNKFSSNPVVS